MNLNTALFINVNIRKEKTFLDRRGDGDNFKSLYRYTRENVQWITDYFLHDQEDTRGGALSNVQKMKTFLRYVGDPGFQVNILGIFCKHFQTNILAGWRWRGYRDPSNNSLQNHLVRLPKNY